MQNARVKGLIITNCCGLSSFVKPDRAIRALSGLSIYLCEKTFSAVVAIKSKYRSRLQLQSDLRVAVSAIQPRMSHLVSNMQAHPSHLVSTVSHFYFLSVSMVSIGEDSMIFLGGHGEN
jgi:hypothetical protein